MIGKQAFNTILEVIMPKIWRKIMAIQVGLSRLFSSKTHDINKEKVERYLRDLKLLDWGPRSLFPEYLEMGKSSWFSCAIVALAINNLTLYLHLKFCSMVSLRYLWPLFLWHLSLHYLIIFSKCVWMRKSCWPTTGVPFHSVCVILVFGIVYWTA